MRSSRLDSVVPAAVMDHLIRRECARADRNGQVFSLVLFHVGGGLGRRPLATHRLARVMLKRGRLTDDIGWLGADYLAALLPDTNPQGAQSFVDGVAELMSGHGTRPHAIIHTYPQDRAHEVLARPAARLGGHAKPSVAPADFFRPSTAHTHAHSHGFVRNFGKADSYSAQKLRTNGHAHSNGHAQLLQAEPAVESSTATLAVDCEELFNPAPVAQALPAYEQPPVVGVEQLLAQPLPIWKRALDIIAASVLLVVFTPVLLLAALAIKLSSPGPVLFLQRRSGLGGKPFLIYKLRTMIVGAEKKQQELRKLNEQDGPAFKLTRDPRVTRIGAFLRKTSIDELPQLLNILKGEMSLVGPRPLPIAEQEGCEQWQRHRLNVTPGLTCIWQVKGRSQVSFADWVRMDVEYIRRRTIFQDLSILFSTIPAVLLRRGAR